MTEETVEIAKNRREVQAKNDKDLRQELNKECQRAC